MKSSNSGLIADIQRCSIHDGPGIRTTVFLKGCPLSCVWCHNPECISPEPQTLFYPEKCIGCGFCAEGCYTGARVTCGREMTPEEVFREIERDAPYYGADGGLTVSGGEPLMQADFCAALLDICKSRGVHRAVETSLLFWNPQVMEKNRSADGGSQNLGRRGAQRSLAAPRSGRARDRIYSLLHEPYAPVPPACRGSFPVQLLTYRKHTPIRRQMPAEPFL